MAKFETQTFNIPELTGISKTNIEEHLKLYAGYVKNTNLILEKIPEYNGYASEDAFAPYIVSELYRRFSFEYNGMRNHEYYFRSFEGGSKEISDGDLKNAIEKEYESFDEWLTNFKKIALTRGVGWAMLYYDKATDSLLSSWVDEQHLGQLQGCTPILALDMWEHSFVADYQPSGKGKYIDDFFANLNWEVIEENYKTAKK